MKTSQVLLRSMILPECNVFNVKKNISRENIKLTIRQHLNCGQLFLSSSYILCFLLRKSTTQQNGLPLLHSSFLV